MTGRASVGSTAAAGTYHCTNCGHELTVQSEQSLPACPECDGPQEWQARTGSGSTDSARSDVEAYGAEAASETP
jgi:predicted RNA-binding Zn-ribbon protein involved in translation (DUF1610 family)